VYDDERVIDSKLGVSILGVNSAQAGRRVINRMGRGALKTPLPTVTEGT